MPPRAAPAPAPALVAAAVAVALTLPAAPARAETEWYGFQVIGTDVVGWTLFLGGVKIETWQLGAVGFGTLLLGGPVVHLAHGNYGRAGISFGMRAAGPALGLAVGGLVASKHKELLFEGPLTGAFLGYLAAAIVDIAVVAREDGPEAAPRLLSIGGRF